MDFQVTSRHLELTDGLKNHASQMADYLEQEFENIISAHLILSVEKHLHVAQFEIHVPGGKFQAKEKSEDMYTSIDRTAKKIESQLRKETKRRQNPKGQTSLAKESPVSIDEDEMEEEGSESP
jgi:putative sigma-54 modulation protein